MKVYITGINGMLGRGLVDYFKRVKYKIFGCDISPNDYSQFDMFESARLKDDIKQANPDYIIHTVANTFVDWCEQNKTESLKLNGLSCEVLQRATKKKIVYISTHMLYDGNSPVPYKETDTVSPPNVYGAHKLYGEQAFAKERSNIAKSHNIVFRCNMFGWGRKEKQYGLVEWILNEYKKSTVKLFHDVWFNPLYTELIGSCIDQAVKKDLHGLYNLGSPDVISKAIFGIKLGRVFNRDIRKVKFISCDDGKLYAKRPKNVACDVSKLLKHIDLPSIDNSISMLKERI